jgi:hypothetical protein
LATGLIDGLLAVTDAVTLRVAEVTAAFARAATLSTLSLIFDSGFGREVSEAPADRET